MECPSLAISRYGLRASASARNNCEGNPNSPPASTTHRLAPHPPQSASRKRSEATHSLTEPQTSCPGKGIQPQCNVARLATSPRRRFRSQAGRLGCISKYLAYSSMTTSASFSSTVRTLRRFFTASLFSHSRPPGWLDTPHPKSSHQQFRPWRRNARRVEGRVGTRQYPERRPSRPLPYVCCRWRRNGCERYLKHSMRPSLQHPLDCQSE